MPRPASTEPAADLVDIVTRVPPALRAEFNAFARARNSTQNAEAIRAMRVWMLLCQRFEEVQSGALTIDALIGQATI